MQYIYLGALVQGLILSVFLFSRKGYAERNVFLGLFLLITCLSLFYSFMYCAWLIDKTPGLIGYNAAFPFLSGPLIYFFVRSFISERVEYTARDLLNFLPFMGVFLWVLINHGSDNERINAARSFMAGNAGLSFYIGQVAMIIFNLAYVSYSFMVLRRCPLKRIEWLNHLLFAFIFIYLLRAVILLIYASDLGETSFLFGLSDLLMIGVIYGLSFVGLKQEKPFFPPVSGSLVRYAESPFSREESSGLYHRLTTYMVEEKPYLSPKLTLSDLARHLETNSKYLSQAINENSRGNFTYFVNWYRVEEFKSRVAREGYGKLTLIAIAEECGFSSKTAFNTIFKKLTGSTPRVYLRQRQGSKVIQ